ncbi:MULTISPECIES: peptidoglycan-associated lipoprotein Pal [Rickettsieae]|uniref:peptidoglycan-associated lipoprotein Pal n=1 Tax=Rickettsieae TaxID=33988 RepID=UPI000B9B4FD3|nr:peptidoglycan-associated lipoprotein Pal [Rickettsia endosymbiont of Culicoides newsteadi]MDN3031040.1 peptidoglycan-associated lipoprotein Pal [Candidatus Tisiphia sp.]
MLKKTTIAFLALFMLSGCGAKKKPIDTGITNEVEESSLASDFERRAGDRVFFALNKSDISPQAKEQLSKQANWLKSHPNTEATIEGHCDERGTREYNLALGERRAEAVRKYLTNNLGVMNKLDTISYGKERPAVLGDNEAAWAQNRRAVTSIK